MLLFVIGLTCCVTSVLSVIPPWSPYCPQPSAIPNACEYGNLTVTLFSKTLKPKDCNSQVNIKEFKFNPVIHINSTNTTDRFTVLMLDYGPEGKGPIFLQWMVTNVSVSSLPSYQNIPPNDILANYEPPLLMQGINHRSLVQLLVFRHQNMLRVPFGELWITIRRNFSFRTLFSNTGPTLRLCGPVAGTQYWVSDSEYTPSAPPAPQQPGVQPIQPVYVPVVPVVPVGQVPSAPAPGAVPGSALQPHPSIQEQHQHVHTTFPKKSSGSVLSPMQLVFIPLVILTIMWL